MNSRKAKSKPRVELTPVDDVRVVRERLSREANNDIATLVEQSRAFAAKLRRKLGLRLVSAPSRRRRPTTTKRRSG